jgi:hypothetical protein
MITRQLLKRPALVERPSTAATTDPYLAERYFTDGISLYRLDGWLTRPGEVDLAKLEDCRSLHSMLLERKALVELALDPVAQLAA